jgi:hypothetical protein
MYNSACVCTPAARFCRRQGVRDDLLLQRDVTVLVILPLLAFLIMYLIVLDSRRSGLTTLSVYRDVFLITSILWGTFAILITEGLSCVKSIGRLEIAISWVIAIFILTAVGYRRGVYRIALARTGFHRQWFTPLEWFIVVGISCAVITLAIIAWISPPNTSDSLAYHMPRIVHWIQNRSLQHYSTAYHPQLLTSYFPEAAILQFWLLWGGDRLANLIQWFSMLGSLLAVSAIAKLLGANKSGQLLATGFALSVPIGILQSTSTQTDYVATLWLLCLAYFVILSKKRELNRLEFLSLMLTSGLGMLTKGTFYTFATPFLLWFFISQLRRHGPKRTILIGVLLVGVMLLMNMGFFLRNIETYGGPLGSSEWLEYKTDLRLTPQSWISATVKQVALNFSSPRLDFNQAIIDFVQDLDTKLGVSGEEFNLIWLWNHEDLAGNPIHLVILVASILFLILPFRKVHQGLPAQYGLTFLAAVFLHIIIVMFDVYGVRHQLTIFILGAPILGVLFTEPLFKRLCGPVTFIFLFLSIPWIVFNSTRPIIALRPSPEPWSLRCKYGCTRTGSIFFRTREDLMFANWESLKEPITSMAEIIQAEKCVNVGLRIDSHDMEYLYEWSLDAPQSGLRIETIYTFPDLERYLDPQFKPCAIICTICQEQDEIQGLSRVYAHGDHALYMRSD